MTASAKFSFKFSIGLPDHREIHEALHCETVSEDCVAKLVPLSRPQSSPGRLFLKRAPCWRCARAEIVRSLT